MSKHWQRGLACAGLLFAAAAHSQAAPAGPFAKVPAFPTVCYTATDPFPAQIEASRAAAEVELAKQKAINAKIKEAQQSMDPMEMASRMQEWMMSNPQEAMQWTQGVQQAGEDSQTIMPELVAAQSKLEEEGRAFRVRYQAAMKQAYAPAVARMAALNKKLSDANECGFGDAECSVPDWALAEYDAIQKQRDAIYVATCPQWWGATGQAHNYLKRYREFLLTKHVPYWTQQDQQNLRQYAIMNTPAASWKSTVAQESVVKYMDAAWEVFRWREDKPICNAKGCRGQQ